MTNYSFTCTLRIAFSSFLLPVLCAVPNGPPQNCTNSTFNARDVGLQWEEPVRALQNGQITGYNLTCFSSDFCASLSADLSATQNSTATYFNILPVSPFTAYTCFLSTINEVGEGPPAQCFFTTQQDGKTLCVGSTLSFTFHFYSPRRSS